MKWILTTTIIACFQFINVAQNIEFGPAVDSETSFTTYLGELNGDHYVSGYNRGKHYLAGRDEVSRLDSNLALVTVGDLKYKQNKKKHDFEEIVFFNDKLYVFTSLFLKREKEVKYFYGKLNMTTLQLEGELIEFASEPFSENKKIGFISVTSHEDRIMVYQSIALLDGELEKFKCLVFNKKMELEEFSVQLPYVDEKYVRGKFTYDGKDKIYLLGKEYLYEDDNPAKLIKKVMHFICYDLKSHEIVDRTIGLGDDMPSKDMLRFNSETGEFLIAGFYSKNHTLDQGGVFFCKVNPDNMVMSEVVKKDFDKEFILSFYSEEGGDEYLEGFEE
ncbi:MAG: hypothetical protein ACPGWM_07230, partial [Flavobacteriales bacterium]